MIEVEESIYNHPKYYDLIFADDWEAEFNFLEGCFEKYLDGDAVSYTHLTLPTIYSV